MAVKLGQRRINEMVLHRAETRMIRWMLGVEVTDRFTCNELRERERLGRDDIITVIQRNRLRRHGHVLTRWLVELKMQGLRSGAGVIMRGRLQKTWTDVEEKDRHEN